MEMLHLEPSQLATFLRLGVALLLGGLIGMERQWRQRSAGLRTNTLVCLGAASFVDLGSTLAGPGSLSVIAYVVSGVGFLGAGAIIKDGAGIRGLNTAATLWCSAAVGACAGAGQLTTSLFVTVLLMVINLAFRPVSRLIDRQSVKGDINVVYRLNATFSDTNESKVRSILLRAIAERPLILRQLRTEDTDVPEDVRLHAEIESPTRDPGLLEEIVKDLREDPTVSSVEFGEGTSEVE